MTRWIRVGGDSLPDDEDREILGDAVKVAYDPEVDVLRILLSDAPIEESDEDKPGVILDYDKDGNVVGLEILEASKRTPTPGLLSIVMKNQRRNKCYSALRERLKREDAADLAKLTPAQRLQAALDLSDFCLVLAAKVREADAQRGITKSRRGAR